MQILFWGIQSWEAIFFKKCILVLGHPNLENCYSFIQSTDDLLRDRSNLSQVRKYQFYKLSIKGFRSSQPILRLKCRPRETRVVGYGVPELCFTPWLKSSVTCSRQKNKGFTFVEAVEFKVKFLQNCFPRPAKNGATLFTAWTLFQSCEIFEFQNVNLGHTGVSFLGCHYQHFTSKLTCS